MIKNLAEQRVKKEKGKKKRIASQIADDLTVVLKTLNLTIQALSYYKKYAPVMEVISTIQTNHTLIEIHLKKYEKLRDEDEKNKLEKT